MGLEPTIFGSGNRRLIHLATGTTSSGTRTHNLTLRRGAPYPLGHGGLPLDGNQSNCYKMLKTTAVHIQIT